MYLIRMRCGLNYKLSERMNQSVMRWYGHMERMIEAGEVNLELSGRNERKR